MAKLLDEHLLKCPECGKTNFIRIQTGYENQVPCRVLKSGKVAVCDYSHESWEEMNDGGDWSRYIVCSQCGHLTRWSDFDASDVSLEASVSPVVVSAG